MRLGNSDRIIIEESESWQKFVMPAKRNWGMFLFYSAAMLVWAGMMIYIFIGLFRPFPITRPFSSNLVWRLILIGWLLVWYFFARRYLWRIWQYYAATREILLINEDEFIIRRPVSLLGITDVYDMKHIQTVEYDADKQTSNFHYGVRRIPFGKALTAAEGQALVATLNHRYFPDSEDEQF